MPSDADLLKRFVACFGKLDDGLVAYHSTDDSFFRPLYVKLPARFPRLFEQLLANYRWPEVHAGCLRLLANPAGRGFDGFVAHLFADKRLAEVLLSHGFIQFGRAVDGPAYDPICFDTRRQRHGRDCPIVRLDHEAALIGSRVRQIAELAPSFRDLILLIIKDSSQGAKSTA